MNLLRALKSQRLTNGKAVMDGALMGTYQFEAGGKTVVTVANTDTDGMDLFKDILEDNYLTGENSAGIKRTRGSPG